MEWISVKDRIPDHLEDVLVTDGTDEYTVAYWNGKEWKPHTDLLYLESETGGVLTISGIITHWIPLPELPELPKG